jgi:hypothetical protein
MQKEVEKTEDKDKKDEKEEEKKEEEEEQPSVDETTELKAKFQTIYDDIVKNKPKDKSFEEFFMKSEEFEKDEDANYHIDFMAALGNCRAINYKLEPMDWIQVKLKAGRIVPAMATTTAAIAGLQALELVKVVQGARKEDYRNAFLNLAVPIMQSTEPGPVPETKLTDEITTNLWDTWEVDAKGKPLEKVIAAVEAKYKGLEVKDVMFGNQPIFFTAIMNAPGKEKERAAVLG